MIEANGDRGRACGHGLEGHGNTDGLRTARVNAQVPRLVVDRDGVIVQDEEVQVDGCAARTCSTIDLNAGLEHARAADGDR